MSGFPFKILFQDYLEKTPKFFPAEPFFFIVFITKCLSKCPNSTKPLLKNFWLRAWHNRFFLSKWLYINPFYRFIKSLRTCWPLLLKKQSPLALKESYFKWFKSFLSNRKQYIILTKILFNKHEYAHAQTFLKRLKVLNIFQMNIYQIILMHKIRN